MCNICELPLNRVFRRLSRIFVTYLIEIVMFRINYVLLQLKRTAPPHQATNSFKYGGISYYLAFLH